MSKSSKIEMKYLCNIESSIESLDGFKHFLTYNKMIKFLNKSNLQFYNQANIETEVEYSICKTKNTKGNYFILSTSSNDIDKISNFNRLIKLVIKNVNNNNVTILKDGISLYYSCIAYRHLHNIENSIRALLTEVMCFYGNNNWVEKEAKEILNIENRSATDSNILYSRNFDQLEKFLFTEYSEYTDKELLHDLLNAKPEDLDNTLQKAKEKLPNTIWDKHFKEFSNKAKIEGAELQKLLSSLYKSRNYIAHCNTFHKAEFDKFESDCTTVEAAIDGLTKLIENNELNTSIESVELEESLTSTYLDTIIVPAQKEGFERVFIGESQWYEIRINNKKIDNIKYIAAYQTAPISAITHFAKVKEILTADDNIYKKKVIFMESAQKFTNPIPLGNKSNLAPQSPRYTSFDQLEKAETLDDLFD